MKSIIIYSVLVFCIALFISCNEESNSIAPVEGRWSYCQGLPNNITNFAASGNNLVAVNSVASIFISFDDGATWSVDTTFHVENHAPHSQLIIGTSATLFAHEGYLFAGIYAVSAALYRSTDNGITWSDQGIIESDSNFTEKIHCFAAIGGDIFAGTYGNGVFISTDHGTHWKAVNNGFPLPYSGWPPPMMYMTVQGTDLFVSTNIDYRIFLSTNSGANWTAVNNGLPNTVEIYGLASIGSKVFAGIYESGISYPGGVYITTDNGLNWSIVNNGLTDHTILKLVSGNGYLFAHTNNSLFISANSGTTWKNISTGTVLDSTGIGTIAVINSQLFVGAWRYPIAALPALIENNKNQQ